MRAVLGYTRDEKNTEQYPMSGGFYWSSHLLTVSCTREAVFLKGERTGVAS